MNQHAMTKCWICDKPITTADTYGKGTHGWFHWDCYDKLYPNNRGDARPQTPTPPAVAVQSAEQMWKEWEFPEDAKVATLSIPLWHARMLDGEIVRFAEDYAASQTEALRQEREDIRLELLEIGCDQHISKSHPDGTVSKMWVNHRAEVAERKLTEATKELREALRNTTQMLRLLLVPMDPSDADARREVKLEIAEAESVLAKYPEESEA